MRVVDEIIKSFENVEIHTIFTRSEIIDRVASKYGRNRESIIPSDYCYNRYNNGVSFENRVCLFKYTDDKKYEYLGLNYPFTGRIFHKPKGSTAEICVAQFVNGVLQKDVSVCNDSAMNLGEHIKKATFENKFYDRTEYLNEQEEKGTVMSKFIDNSITIFEAMDKIRNKEYVMPAFQRQYVWKMEQIEKLWDSILLDYPIATFLFWHVDDDNTTWDTYFCDFLSKVTFDSTKQADSSNYELISIDVKKTNIAVLDGQQRLTSLFLSLFGEACIRPKHARKKSSTEVITKLFVELNKNKLTIDEGEYNSKKFDIRFSDKVGKLSPTQFELRKILEPEFQNEDTRDAAIDKAIVNVPSDSKEYARDVLNKLYNKIFVEKLVRYTEILDMKQDDALEMFVRFNSGGKVLRKSEIMMSILEAYWSSAKEEFGKVLRDSYKNFSSDFIIRTALMLYGDVTKSNINKGIAEELKNNWSEFKKALKNLDEVLFVLKIDVGRFSGSWSVLVPIVYFIYNNDNYKQNIEGIRAYLVRAVLFTYFQAGTKGKLQQMKSYINSFDMEISVDMLNQMNELKVTDGKIEDVLDVEKGSRIAGEVLYYLSLEWRNKHFFYEQDHLHPESRFDGSRPYNVNAGDWIKWRTNRNRLPNLHLLEGRSNGSKSDRPLVDYFNDMTKEQQEKFYKESYIPDNVSLGIENFGEFFEQRKSMLREALKRLLG